MTDCGAQVGCPDPSCVGCTNTASDSTNCGGCGSATFGCASGDACVDSTCTPEITCTTTADCATNGADPNTICQNGICGCATGQTDCGSTTGCTNTTMDPNNCNTCGNACNATGENGACVGGTCELGTPTPTPTPNGQPVLAPSLIETFGVQIGNTVTKSVTLTNDQPDNPLNLTAITIAVTSPTGAAVEWSETDSCGINDPTGTSSPMLSEEGHPGSQCTIMVTFSPMVGGEQIASLSIASDFTGTAPAVELIGSAPNAPTPTSTGSSGGGPGIPPAPQIIPSSITFGPEIVGGTSDPQTVTLTNQSSIPLVINASPASPPAPAGVAVTGPFAIASDNCSGVTLDANGKCTVTVEFMPVVAGPKTGTLTFGDNAVSNILHPQNVQLLGTGSVTSASPTPSGPVPPPPEISPSSIDFGTETVGVATGSHTVTVINQSSIPLAMASPATSIVGPFAIASDTCSGATVGGNASCVVTLTFTPTGAGPVTGTLSFLDNASTSVINPQTVVQLRGSGTFATPVPTPGGQTPPPPVISPAQISFGSEIVGGVSAAQAVTLSNQSSVPLVMSTTTVTGEFAIASDACSNMTVSAGGKCIVMVTFNPIGAGAQSGALSFSDNAPPNIENPQKVSLTGEGSTSTPAPTAAPPGQSASSSISPPNLNFAAVAVGTTSPPMTAKITSTSPTVPLSISSVTITSNGGAGVASQFSETDSCTGSLGNGQSCTVSVTFTPANTGAQQASLVFNDNVAANVLDPQAVALAGTGSAPSH